MKPALIILVLLSIAPSAVFAQTGAIGIFADPNGAGCNIVDQTVELVHAYIIHAGTPGALSSRFMVVWDPCLSMPLLDETVNPSYTFTGTTTSGIEIFYGDCIPSPNVLVKYSFFAQGFTPSCCWMHVVDDPSVTPPGIYVTECSDPFTPQPATGWNAVVNGNYNCPCSWSPTEHSSWGRVKAIYK